jgi:hypothetical protein
MASRRVSSVRDFIAFPIDLGVYITLVGLLFYGLSRVSLNMFYLPLGSEPEELGLDYARTLANVIGILIVIPIVIALLTALIVALVPLGRLLLRASVVGIVVFLVVLFLPRLLVYGTLAAFYVFIFLVLLPAILIWYYVLPVITLLTFIALIPPNPYPVPQYRTWASLVGATAIAIWLMSADLDPWTLGRIIIFGIIIAIEYRRVHTSKAVVHELDTFIARLVEALSSNTSEANAHTVPTVPKGRWGLYRQAQLHLNWAWRSATKAWDIFFDSPKLVILRMQTKLRHIRLRQQHFITSTKQKLQIRPREGLSDRLLRLTRSYFRVLASVLLVVVLALFLVVPDQCYQLGKAVSQGETYISLEAPSTGLWNMLLAFPVRAEPARVESLTRSDLAQEGRETRSPGQPFSDELVCAIYLGSDEGLSVLYLQPNASGVESRTYRVPVESVSIETGPSARKECADKIKPNTLRNHISRWATAQRTERLNSMLVRFRRTFENEWARWSQTADQQ